MDRRRKIIFWQGLIVIWGGAFFLVYLTEWNSVAVAVVAVATHFLWRWGVNKKTVVNIVLPYALPQTFCTILSALVIHG